MACRTNQLGGIVSASRETLDKGKVTHQPFASLGQFERPVQAEEQRLAEPFLKCADLVADCGLCHAQFLGRACEAQMLSGAFEYAQG